MLVTALIAHSLLALPARDDAPEAIDFSQVDRTLETEPDYVASPRYGLFLFGEQADHRVWAVLDKSAADGAAYDVLYLDRDADGVLGEEGERLVAEVGDSGNAVFDIGDFVQPVAAPAAGEAPESAAEAPAEPTIHTDFKVTWTKDSVRYRMKWKGKTTTMGTFGPTRDTYASFGDSKKNAAVLVPGYDRPLEFEHWMSGTLAIGRATDFKVFVGARGSVQGAFSCGDEQLLPDGEYVIATLIYDDERGEEKRVQCKLRERC